MQLDATTFANPTVSVIGCSVRLQLTPRYPCDSPTEDSLSRPGSSRCTAVPLCICCAIKPT